MRKIVLCMLAAIIAISTLTGCPANNAEESSGVGGSHDSGVTEPADKSSGSAVESNSADNGAASTANTAQGEIGAAPEIPAADDFIPTVDESIIYRSGTWYFTSNDKDGNKMHYLYLTDSKELISFEPEDTVVDVSGYLVAYENGTLMNVKTGEVYAGGDTGFEYIKTEANEEYAFANDGTAMIVKIDPGFDSVAVNIGVLNNDGTWRNEITSDNVLDTHTEYDLNRWSYVGDGFVYIYSSLRRLYNSDNDYLVDEDYWKYVYYYIYSNETIAYFIDDSPERTFSKLYCLNKESKTINELSVEGDPSSVSYNISGSCVAYAAPDIDWDVHNPYVDWIVAHNMEKDEYMLFDISAFEIRHPWNMVSGVICGVLDNALMFKSEGADGSEYTCMINQEGERLIEPKIMDFVCIVDDKFLCTVDGTLTMFDTSGKETKLPGKLAYSSVTADNYGSIIAVETDEGFKLVDLNDPENPFTPFDAI